MDDYLILQAARLGDLIQTKRLVKSLSRKGQVHLAVDRDLAPLAQLLYPAAIIHGVNFHGSDVDLRQTRQAFAELSAISFSQIYNCNFSGLTSAVCRLFDENKIIGYRPAHHSDGGSYLSPWARIAFRIARNRSATSINLADFWGWFTPGPVKADTVNPSARGGGRGLGVALAGRAPRRSLPPEIMAEVVRTVFFALDGPEVRLFGTALEKPLARRLARHLPAQAQEKTVDLCGRTDWPQLLAEMTDLDCLITPDTGLMHLAAHLGVPVLAFFLSSAWCHETGPYGEGHQIWQSAPSCAPCLESAACPHGSLCLEAFRKPDFARFLLAQMRGDKKILAELPTGLQLWQTEFDDLGQRLRLEAGRDEDASRRTAARTIISDFLGLPRNKLAKLPAGEVKDALAVLFPPDEWMAPPYRYY